MSFLLWNKLQGSNVPAAVTPVFNFDSALATFTPLMALRVGSLFAASPMVQGDMATEGGDSDTLTVARGSFISGQFYTNFDVYQGSISFLITPEWAGNDGITHYIIGRGSTDTASFKLFKNSSNSLVMDINGATASVSISGWAAGTTYSVVVRWDVDNTLDGTNYMCLSVNDTHTFGRTTAITGMTTYPNAGTFWIGAEGNLLTNPANARIEGLTIYRRPLFDGTYGCNVGNGDEINLIYNSGTFKDPCEVTGSWDVCFCLPTNSTPGTLSTGSVHAWSQPSITNLVTAADGFMTNATAWTNWTDIGLPLSEAVLATAEKIFNWGYKFVTTAGGDGEEYTKVVVAGDDWVIRAIVHSASAVDVILYDKSNAAEIGKLTSGGATTVGAPFVAIFSGEAPAGCISLGVRIQGTAVTQTVYCHQVELLANLFTNPSLATGAGDPWIPTGWTNTGIDAGESIQEATIVHSGVSSLGYVAGILASELVQQAETVATSAFHMCGAWTYGNGTQGIYLTRLSSNQILNRGLSTANISALNATIAWAHVFGIVRQSASTGGGILLKPSATIAGASVYVDDTYLFALTAVSVTATPASLANSTEASGIRVDGLDTLSQPVTASYFSATVGIGTFGYTPRHAAADALKFGNATAYIAEYYGNATNYIRIYWSLANTITLAFDTGASPQSGTWDATGAIVAGTTYTIRVEYTASNMILKVGGTTRITITQPVSFAVTPTTLYLGLKQDVTLQGDATFAAAA